MCFHQQPKSPILSNFLEPVQPQCSSEEREPTFPYLEETSKTAPSPKVSQLFQVRVSPFMRAVKWSPQVMYTTLSPKLLTCTLSPPLPLSSFLWACFFSIFLLHPHSYCRPASHPYSFGDLSLAGEEVRRVMERCPS